MFQNRNVFALTIQWDSELKKLILYSCHIIIWLANKMSFSKMLSLLLMKRTICLRCSKSNLVLISKLSNLIRQYYKFKNLARFILKNQLGKILFLRLWKKKSRWFCKKWKILKILFFNLIWVITIFINL